MSISVAAASRPNGFRPPTKPTGAVYRGFAKAAVPRSTDSERSQAIPIASKRFLGSRTPAGRPSSPERATSPRYKGDVGSVTRVAVVNGRMTPVSQALPTASAAPRKEVIGLETKGMPAPIMFGPASFAATSVA